MGINLSANWQLMRCFDALLRAILFRPRHVRDIGPVANGAGLLGALFGQQALGLDMLVKIYAAENVKTKLKVNLIDPGEVRTRMHAQAMPGFDANLLPPPEAITDIFVKLASESFTETGKKFYVR